MRSIFRLSTLAALLSLALLLPAISAPAQAKDPVYTGTFSSLAIGGYDPVAYFTDGKAVEGKDSLEFKWNGATWRFTSQDHLNAFKADPEKYAPQYGGYCAWAVSQGYTASSDPYAWKIVGDKLYLNYSPGVQANWMKDIPGNIAKADANWPKVLQ
jgi:YHS domain-containing protein